jgi:uncharacterized membrane protein
MNNRMIDLTKKLLNTDYEELTERERNVINNIANRKHISRNTNREFDQTLTFGQHLADQVAAFGGSWPFIISFGVFLGVWMFLNSVILPIFHNVFDPYPFILLNLVLSTLAAIQAPLIMMSQNRQAAKDRIDAAHDYEVNLKSELEIMGLHQKVDSLREQQWAELIALQQEQIRLLTQLLDEKKS